MEAQRWRRAKARPIGGTIVAGTPWDPQGNPVPKVRTTRGQKWRTHKTVVSTRTGKAEKRLTAWGRYVAFANWFRAGLSTEVRQQVAKAQETMAKASKGDGQAYYLDVRIGFKGRRFGDSGNVCKAIEDILFPGKRGGDKWLHTRLEYVKWDQGGGWIEFFLHGPYRKGEVPPAGFVIGPRVKSGGGVT